jgi:hypothetical protein
MRQAHTILRRWLAAERRGGAAASERALAELLAWLPEARPRPGFGDRVMAAAGLPPTYSAVAAPPIWLGRALVAVCLLLTAVAVAYLPALAMLVARQLTLADVLSAMAQSLTAAIDYLAAAMAIGKTFAALYEAMLRVVTAPPLALAWLSTLVFSTLTLRWLARLLSPQRSPRYVPTH